MSLSANQFLANRYRIESLLSEGGMGAVYQAFDTTLEMRVAIKENFFDTKEAVDQFRREALILAKLNHPSLPRVTDHFTLDKGQYLVMDFIRGVDLWELLKQQRRPLPEAQAIDYVCQICETLTYLHSQDPPIVHRDIKPQNIKITPDNRAVLVDFGIAKIAASGQKTMVGARGVTPGFSPPEQHAGSGTTPRSDIYALGATFYAILTGRKPPDSLALWTSRQTAPPVTHFNPQLNPEIAQAVNWAMALQIEQRPATAQIWQAHLKNLTPGQRLAAAKTRPPIEPGVASTSRYYLVDYRGQQYPLNDQQTSIGRRSENDIQLRGDDKVSRRHAMIQLRSEQCWVYDAGSSNGTFINQQPVSQQGQVLRLGEELMIGRYRFQLHRVADSPTDLPTRAISESMPASPPVTTTDYVWDEPAKLSPIAGMTQMLTHQLVEKMSVMSPAQLIGLAGSLIVCFALGTVFAGAYIRINYPMIWFLFNPFYYLAGPVVAALSRRRGTALGVHLIIHVIVTSLTWSTPDYWRLWGAGLVGGLILEGSFSLSFIPGWFRFPVAILLAYFISLLIFGRSVEQASSDAGLGGAILVGLLVYLISEIYKGVQAARS